MMRIGFRIHGTKLSVALALTKHDLKLFLSLKNVELVINSCKSMQSSLFDIFT
jgi:hypothetical protein